MLGHSPPLKVLKQEFCLNNYAKNQKHSMSQFVIRLKKLTWDVFIQNPGKRFSQKKSFEPIFSLYAAAISCKNSEKFHAVIFHKIWKIHFSNSCKKLIKFNVLRFDKVWKNITFGPISEFWKQNFCCRKSFKLILSFHDTGKPETLHAITFGNTWITLFWAHSAPKNLRTNIFMKGCLG